MSTNSETTTSQDLLSYTITSTGDNDADANSLQANINEALDDISIKELLHVAICADISGTIWSVAVTYENGDGSDDSCSEYEVAVAIDTNTDNICNTLNGEISSEQSDKLVPALINWSYSSTGVILATVGLAPVSEVSTSTYEVINTTDFEQSVQQIEEAGGTVIDSCVNCYGPGLVTYILYKSGS